MKKQSLIEIGKQIAKLESEGKTQEALELQAQATQQERKASQKKKPYDVWQEHEHFTKFETEEELWQQARRCAHGDAGSKNNVSALAAKFVAKADELDGKSSDEIFFAFATLAKNEESDHYIEVRNQIAKLENEAKVRRLLVETDGDADKAKALAKTRKIKFAKIIVVGESDDATIEDDASVQDEAAQ